MEQARRPAFPLQLIKDVHAALRSSNPEASGREFNNDAEALRRCVVYYDDTLSAVRTLLTATPETLHAYALHALCNLHNALSNGVPPEGLQELCQSACRNVILRCAGDVTVRLWTTLNDPAATEQWAVADAEAAQCEKALELLTWECGYHKTSVAGGLREQRERYRRKVGEGATQPQDPAN